MLLENNSIQNVSTVHIAANFSVTARSFWKIVFHIVKMVGYYFYRKINVTFIYCNGNRNITIIYYTYIADWNELFTTKCIACGFPIEAGDRWVEALNSNYHSPCFNCSVRIYLSFLCARSS